MNVHSNGRMHTMKPREIFHIIILNLYSTDLIAAGFDDTPMRLFLSTATTSSVEGPKGLEYKQEIASVLHSTKVQSKTAQTMFHQAKVSKARRRSVKRLS